MPASGRDPLQMEAPNEADLKTIGAGMRWFDRVFGFSSAAIEADTRDVNMKSDGTLTMESTHPDVAKQLWQSMISYTPRYDLITAPILAIYALSDTHPFLTKRSHLRPARKSESLLAWRVRALPKTLDRPTTG
jgi:hypothetical protein